MQEDETFKVILGYKESLRPAWIMGLGGGEERGEWRRGSTVRKLTSNPQERWFGTCQAVGTGTRDKTLKVDTWHHLLME